jgi:hypothetical protein
MRTKNEAQSTKIANAKKMGRIPPPIRDVPNQARFAVQCSHQAAPNTKPQKLLFEPNTDFTLRNAPQQARGGKFC